MVESTRERLDADVFVFLRGLPLTHEDGGVLHVRANAYAPARRASPRSRVGLGRRLAATDASLTVRGHVHEPMLWTMSGVAKLGEFVPVPGTAIPIPGHRRWLAMSGSVGQPRDGDPAACWALFDATARTLCRHRVPCDHAGAARRIREAGLPERFAARLETGARAGDLRPESARRSW